MLGDDLNDVTVSVNRSINNRFRLGWGNNTYGRGAWGEFAADIGLGADVSTGVSQAASSASGMVLQL